jgi:hypothetical protein
MKLRQSWIALPAGLLLTGCSVLSPFIVRVKSTNDVPWIAATVGPAVSPSADPLPAGVQPCDVSQLVISAWTAGGGGTVLGRLTLSASPADARSCSLGGPPASIAIQQTDTGAEIHTAYSASRRSGPGAPDAASGRGLLVDEGNGATAAFIWTNWCGGHLDRIRFLVKTARATSAPVGISNAVEAGSASARCDRPGLPSHVTGYAFRKAPSQPGFVDVAIDVPPTAVVGMPLEYEITLTNNDVRPLSLEPCPPYTEELYQPKHAGSYRERWLLNCSELPARIWPGEHVDLAMRIDIPRDAPLGPQEIAWDFPYGRAEAPIEVLAR